MAQHAELRNLDSGSILGPYRIARRLGEGGMGQVFEAIHQTIERYVALKVLRPEYAANSDVAARFFDEARAVNRIDHPCIVQISDYGRAEDGTTYLVMELLRGESLSRRLFHHRDKPLPISEVLRITWQIADALRAAHAQGIVHRDIKPDNIMLVPDPIAPGGERVKVLDFGIAKLAQGAAHFTAINAVMGTPRYMSPEQCRNTSAVDDKSDVYSLGVLIYKLLSGRCPFESDGAPEIMCMHLFKEPPPLHALAPHAPPSLLELTSRLLQKDGAARPSMAEVEDALWRLGASTPGRGHHSDLTKLGSSSEGAALVPLRELAAWSPAGPEAGSTLDRHAAETRRGARRLPHLIAALATGALLCALTWLMRGEPRRSQRQIPPRRTALTTVGPPSSTAAPVIPSAAIQPSGTATEPPQQAAEITDPNIRPVAPELGKLNPSTPARLAPRTALRAPPAKVPQREPPKQVAKEISYED